MIKKERYIATHMDTDSAPDKRDTTSYYAAYNLEVTHNGRNLSINPTKIKGSFATGSFEVLVGDVVIDEILYLFEHKSSGIYPDIIHQVLKNGTVTEIVKCNFGWINNTKLDIVGNRENENIIKVYWADGNAQLRTLNIAESNWPDLSDGMNADIVLPVLLSKPVANIIQGGNLIAGKVQYAYSVFNLHGVESIVSPLSIPLSISFDMEGGESAEVMPLSAEVSLTNIDTNFEYIRIYSIHYQELNQTPKISLIYETQISGTSLTIIDDGNLFISELNEEQFKFLGGVVLKPTTIAIKDNILFAANYKTTNFDIPDTENLDSKVFGAATGSPIPQAYELRYQFSFSSVPWTTQYPTALMPVLSSYLGVVSSPSGGSLPSETWAKASTVPAKTLITRISTSGWNGAGSPTVQVEYGIRLLNGVTEIWNSDNLAEAMANPSGHLEITTNGATDVDSGYIDRGVVTASTYDTLEISIYNGEFGEDAYQFDVQAEADVKDLNSAVSHKIEDILLAIPDDASYENYTIESADSIGENAVITVPFSDTVAITSSVFIDASDLITLTLEPTTHTTEVDVTGTVWLTVTGMRTPLSNINIGIKQDGGGLEIYSTPEEVWNNDPEHDAINFDYSIYKYQLDGVTLGYEGTNFKLSFSTTTNVNKDTRSLKQGEVYRVGVVYRDQYSRTSPAKWMNDIKTPYYTPGTAVFLACEFIGNVTAFNDAGATSFQLVIVKREARDRSVSSPGFIVPGAEYRWTNGDLPTTGYIHPYYTLKRMIDFTDGGDIYSDYTVDYDWDAIAATAGAPPTKHDDIQFFYSSDTLFLINEMYPVTSVRILGTAYWNTPAAIDDETKITYFEDGGVESQRIFSDIEYQGYDVDTILMPDHYMAINPNNEGTAYIPVFETTMFHKFPSYEVWNEISNESNILSCISVILKEGESNSSNTKVSNSINVNGLVYEFNSSGSGRFITSYNAVFANSIAITFDSATWHVNPNGSGDYSMFKAKASLGTSIRLPLIELIRDIPNQYGGATYEDKQRNNYLLNGVIIEITGGGGGENDNALGDVYIGPLIVNRSDGENTQKRGYWNLYEYVQIAALEHNVDIYSRNDEMYNWYQGLDTSTLYGLYRLEDNHKLLGAYNQQNELILGIAKPATFDTVENFEASIIASKQKFPNEVIDSWTDFLVNETMDLIGIHGSITKLYNFTNEIFSFQNRGISAITINPRIQLQADDGIGVELGTGTILYDYKYLTIKSGTRYMWSIIDDGNVIYYYDHISKSINIHTGEELSTAKKVRNLMQTTIPDDLIQVRAIFNIGKNDLIYVFDTFSLVFNKYIGEFIRVEDVHTYLHSFSNRVFSKVNTDILEHYAGTDYNAMHITYMFAPMPTMDKVFHNIKYRKKGTGNFNYISAEDTIGRTGIINSPDIFNKFNINRIHIPRIDNELERFRDVNILLTLQSPESENEFWIDDMVLMYNIKG